MTYLENGIRVLEQVTDEADRAQAKYGDFASMHEAYGVLSEEIAELFDAIRMKQGVIAADGSTRGQCIRAEAIQVAAVALRIAAQAEQVTR